MPPRAPLRLDTIARHALTRLSTPNNDPAVVTVLSVIKATAEKQLPEGAEGEQLAEAIEELEEGFLSSLEFDDLVMATSCNPLWNWMNDLIRRRFADLIPILTPEEVPNSHKSFRVALSLVNRLVEKGLTNVPNAPEEFRRQYYARMAYLDARRDRDARGQSEPDSNGETTVPSSPNAPRQRLQSSGVDTTRNRRAVQNHFPDSAKAERAKFSGVLTVGPSFALFEQRYRSLCKQLNMEERERVQLLSEALSEPALSFFYNNICPDDARSGNSRPEAHAVPSNLAANIPTLSGAFAAIRARFCTDAARNVLKQELDQMTLAAVEQTKQVSKPIALALMADDIRRLSANGPPEFASEACMIAALRKCLSGEAWAVDPLINANDRASANVMNKTLEHYVQTLISYLREKETLSGGPSLCATRTVPMSHGLAELYNINYGDSRATPRYSRVAYQSTRGSRPQHQRQGPSLRPIRPNPTGLPSGLDLRRMLLHPPQHQTPTNRQVLPGGPSPRHATPATTVPRRCWNCDSPDHLLRNCPHPRRPRMDFARAMLVDRVDPVDVAIWMAQEADDVDNSGTRPGEIAGVGEITDIGDNARLGDDADVGVQVDNDGYEDDPIQVFDTLVASLSRSSQPRQDFP